MSKLIDLTGLKVGHLTVLKKTDERKNGEVIWECQCDCGNITKVRGRYLREKHTQSCGCLKKEVAAIMGKNTFHDLTNQRFGKLVVIKKTNRKQGSNYIWECRCDCGNIHFAPGADLVCGKIKSCGCKRLEAVSAAHAIDIIGQKFGKLLVLEQSGKSSDGSFNYLCQCDCGNQKIVNGVSLRQGQTTSCGCINYSIGEKIIRDILVKNNIKFKQEYTFSDFPRKRYDFVIFNDNDKIQRIIEFDGRQHYESSNSIWEQSSSLSERQQRDKEKNEYALSHNIPLVRIPYWERDNITLDMIMGDEYLVK